MFNNTLPDYSQGESFFTVFGVFFPAATGTVFFILPVFPSSHIMETSRSKGSSSGLLGGPSRAVLDCSRLSMIDPKCSGFPAAPQILHTSVHLNVLFCVSVVRNCWSTPWVDVVL